MGETRNTEEFGSGIVKGRCRFENRSFAEEQQKREKERACARACYVHSLEMSTFCWLSFVFSVMNLS